MNFNFLIKKNTVKPSKIEKSEGSDSEFKEAINLFKTQRKKYGFTLEELSQRTNISRNVLIAIENGWAKYLPEKIYLISMLKRLEVELNIDTNSLNGLLCSNVINPKLSKLKFNFINIDFLCTWKGSLLYIILMLLSILALNRQQQYLLLINSQSTQPIIFIENNIEEEHNILNLKGK